MWQKIVLSIVFMCVWLSGNSFAAEPAVKQAAPTHEAKQVVVMPDYSQVQNALKQIVLPHIEHLKRGQVVLFSVKPGGEKIRPYDFPNFDYAYSSEELNKRQDVGFTAFFYMLLGSYDFKKDITVVLTTQRSRYEKMAGLLIKKATMQEFGMSEDSVTGEHVTVDGVTVYMILVTPPQKEEVHKPAPQSTPSQGKKK